MTASESPASNEHAVEIERILAAPRALVWRAWTDPQHFARWYGPEGFSVPACEIDLRVGGRRFIGMRSPDGFEMWLVGVFQEIVPLERFVVTEAMADAEGAVVPPSHYGMPDDVPSETLVTVSLEDLGQGRTRLSLRQAGWPQPEMAAGAGGGWAQALDKLEAELANLA